MLAVCDTMENHPRPSPNTPAARPPFGKRFLWPQPNKKPWNTSEDVVVKVSLARKPTEKVVLLYVTPYKHVDEEEQSRCIPTIRVSSISIENCTLTQNSVLNFFYFKFIN